MSGLVVEGLSVGRGGRRLLDALAFEVPGGTALSLHGRNGLGKTTLLRTLAGLTPPMGGTLNHDTEAVAYAAHSDAIKPTLTVEETLRFWAALHDRPGAETAALAAFGAEDLARRPGGVLSAGQRRRVALARLHLSGRPIWLLDEPTAGLDAAGQGQLAAALEAHLATGGVAVMVTHGAPPIACAALDLDPFGARAPRADDAFAEAVE
ncbi:MAG: heme ABC exporter ATP-binding protein CcmA [Pseudomonadota bacterium]